MTTQAQPTRTTQAQPHRLQAPYPLALAIVAALAAACDGRDDAASSATGETSAVRGDSDRDSAGTVTIRRTAPADGGAGQRGAQTAAAQQGSGQSGQATGGSSGDESAEGDVSRQAAANVEDTITLGTFSPTTPPSESDLQGRLPAPGDLTVYVPNTNLFPGSARLDPGIENPYSGDPDAIAAGERHFNAFNCSGCHAPLGGGGMGPPLSDDQWIHGDEPAQIYLTIVHGRPEGMPAFGSMLPRRTVWELVAYIETLSEIDDYATHAGFDVEHSTSVYLRSRFGNAQTGQQGSPQERSSQAPPEAPPQPQ